MYTRKLFVRNFVIPSFSVGVVHAKGEQENKDDCDDTKKLIRPRELPLYVEPPSCVSCSNTIESEDGFLLTTIRCARQEFQQVLEQARMIQVEASNVVDEVKKETEDVVHYLRQEENLLPRLGAIGLGGFAGYLLACRRGLIKKTLYTAAGATLIAALAYPNEAREITEEVTCEVKKYAVIGYHFLNGVSKDLTGYQLPTLSLGHLNISDSAHPPPDAVPSTAHLLPPVATPTHIPLPGEDPHESEYREAIRAVIHDFIDSDDDVNWGMEELAVSASADVDWKKLDESCQKGGGGGVGNGADKQETTQSLKPDDSQSAEKGSTEQKTCSDVKQGGDERKDSCKKPGAEKFKSYTDRCREQGGSCTKKKGESGPCNDTKRTEEQQQTPVLTRPQNKKNAAVRRNCLQERTKPEEGRNLNEMRPAGDAPLPGDPTTNPANTPGSGVSDGQKKSCRPPPGPSETPRSVEPDEQYPTCRGQGELPRADMTPSGPVCPRGGNPCVRREDPPAVQQQQQQEPPNWTQKCDCPDPDSSRTETGRSSSPNSETSSQQPGSETHTTPCPPSPIKHSVVTIRYPADPDDKESVVVKGSQPKEVSNENTTPQPVPVSEKFPSPPYKPFTPLKFWGRDQP